MESADRDRGVLAGFPWSMKKAMFLDKHLWSEMCAFHPADWEAPTGVRGAGTLLL